MVLQVAALLLSPSFPSSSLLPFSSFLQFIILDEQNLEASISEEHNKVLDAETWRVLVLVSMALKYLQVAQQFHALYDKLLWYEGIIVRVCLLQVGIWQKLVVILLVSFRGQFILLSSRHCSLGLFHHSLHPNCHYIS